ncbi:hypothetical protein K438DRAFT_564051 [Mycena galopus ATCC 62051]|nr:hypothetical protein K438DRAFT_564051 [Mycena galopus ATCC 62051]
MLSSLAADRTRVAALDAEISALKRSLFALRTEKQLAQKRLDSFKYPVLTLPTEIVTEIFLHFLPIYPQCPPLTGLDSPALLAQICREWREIAVETPTLWRAILLSYSGIPFDRQAHLLDMWLSRSRCCPLSVRFDDFDLHDAQHASKVLSAVVPHRARCEYLGLNLSPSHITIIAGPMPLLRHLDLTVIEELDDIVTFSPAPLLRSITLRVTTPLKVGLPLGQMISLTLNLAFRYEYVAILQQTCNLVHCELGIVSDWVGASDLPPDHSIELPCLESLIFKHAEVPDSTGYLDDFFVPALRSLRLGESFLGPEPIDQLSSFIVNSGCKLKEIYVADRTLVSKASYREAFPLIHRFSFDDDSDAANISTNPTDQ